MEIKFILFLLYGGPDQLIPLASFVGAIIGFLLILWQRFVGVLRRAFRFIGEKIKFSRK